MLIALEGGVYKRSELYAPRSDIFVLAQIMEGGHPQKPGANKRVQVEVSLDRVAAPGSGFRRAFGRKPPS